MTTASGSSIPGWMGTVPPQPLNVGERRSRAMGAAPRWATPSAPYAEQTIVHGGSQSMPLFYDNPGATSYSEATRTFAVPQDWVQGGIKTLVLYFHGAADNAAGQLYVKINNTKVVYNGKADVLTMPLWKQWNIDLASVGGNLRSVRTPDDRRIRLGQGDRVHRRHPAVSVCPGRGATGGSGHHGSVGLLCHGRRREGRLRQGLQRDPGR